MQSHLALIGNKGVVPLEVGDFQWLQSTRQSCLDLQDVVFEKYNDSAKVTVLTKILSTEIANS